MVQELQNLLGGLRGHTVTRVFMDQWSCGLLTDESAMLSLVGAWTLLDGEGHLLDSAVELQERKDFNLWRICGGRLSQVTLSGE